MRAALIPLLALAACGQEPADKFAFKDVAVTLPQDNAFFPPRNGAEADAINRNCAACHSTSMILLQPALTSDQWKAEIKKMREVYKAPIDLADEGAILAYLNATSAELGPPKVAPTR
jgi:cytochrome c5